MSALLSYFTDVRAANAGTSDTFELGERALMLNINHFTTRQTMPHSCTKRKQKERKKRENAAQRLEPVSVTSRRTNALRVDLGCPLDRLDRTLVLALGKNNADANRAALVADHKSAKRRECLIRLDADGSCKG